MNNQTNKQDPTVKDSFTVQSFEEKVKRIKEKYSSPSGQITLLEGESWELFDEIAEAHDAELREIKKEMRRNLQLFLRDTAIKYPGTYEHIEVGYNQAVKHLNEILDEKIGGEE